MRTVVVMFLVVVLILGVSGIAFAVPVVEGEAFIIVDGTSGQILEGKNYDTKLHPASTTKILTTILALEKGKLTDRVTVSKNAPAVEGTKVYLREGEKITLEELLNAAIIHSANDAAIAIAEHISGSEEKFAQLMNEKAREIGAKNSNFVNSHGLTDEEHVTTAYDLALIAKYAMENSQFRELANKKVYDWEGEEWQTRLINKNSFLWRMPEATGIKPGYTSQAKYTLVASAEKEGQELICVILGSSANKIWDDAKVLLNYGFDNFQSLSLTKKDEIVATLKINEEEEVNLVPAEALATVVSNNEENLVKKQIVLRDYTLPIEKGQILGELIITINGEEKERVFLKSLEEAKKPVNWLQVTSNFLAGIFLLQIFMRIARRIKKRRRKTIFGSSGRRISSYRM